MSYRLKLTITISLLIAISFGIGGTLMIATSFYTNKEKETQTARQLVEVLRKAAPDTVIAITSSPGGSLDQDSWGKGYGTMQSCHLANRTFIDYNRAMKKLCETSGDPKLVFVPVSQGVDHLNAYPRGPVRGNALHSNKEGGQQIANALFAWLACDLGEK